MRASVASQQLIVHGLGFIISCLLGGVLVLHADGVLPALLEAPFTLLLAATVLVRAFRRFRRLDPRAVVRLDTELFTVCAVAAYTAVLEAPGGLRGSYYPAIYLLIMLLAGFSRPPSTLTTVGFALGLEAAICRVSGGNWSELLVHAALMLGFAVVNVMVFRAEIARVRRLSRGKIESELLKIKDAARSYRLIGVPSSAVEPTSVRPVSAPPGDPERLLRSSIEQLHQSLSFGLDSLRQALGARTAMLLFFDDRGTRLHIRELSTSSDDIDEGPFNPAEGVFAAAVARGEMMTLEGEAARRHMPYYSVVPPTDLVLALPLMEHGGTVGLLVVDRHGRGPLVDAEQTLLAETAQFVLRSVENERVFVQLERAKVEQGKLYHAVDRLAEAQTELQVIEIGVSLARAIAAFDFAAVTLFHRGRGEHEICAISGEGADELVGRRFKHNAGLVGMAVANRHPLPYRGDYDPARQLVFSANLRPPSMRSLLVLPLIVQSAVLGTLVLGSGTARAFGESVRPTLEVLARHIAVSLSNARMMKRLEDLATTDGMTGLFNKRALTEIARQKILAAERFSRPISVLVCDIDHFKKVNDTYGHDVGDVVIKGFGDVFRRVKRDIDVVGRFGGEEFVVVCEETDADGARLLAERIRSELEATQFHVKDGTVNVTCSVGTSTFPGAGSDWESLFKACDEALYVSKRGGRNSVTVWHPGMRGAAA